MTTGIFCFFSWRGGPFIAAASCRVRELVAHLMRGKSDDVISIDSPAGLDGAPRR
jgi:hypothetical protein